MSTLIIIKFCLDFFSFQPDSRRYVYHTHKLIRRALSTYECFLLSISSTALLYLKIKFKSTRHFSKLCSVTFNSYHKSVISYLILTISIKLPQTKCELYQVISTTLPINKIRHLITWRKSFVEENINQR